MRNGRSALLAMGVLAASFAGGFVGQWVFRGADTAYAASRHKEVAPVMRARSFEVVDARGDLLVRLTATPDGPMLSMRKAKGRDVIGIGFVGEGAGFAVTPKPTGARIAIGASLDGKYAGMNFFDGHNEKVVTLGTARPEQVPVAR